MFKKLKDKLAEEVKSSPQRIHQFAQAAQAAVTSASSSISDITNSDLFSIGDNDTQQQSRSTKTQSSLSQQNTFQDVHLVQPLQSPSESLDYGLPHDIPERQRRLSNSSFASDVSFRLPSYETPSMYHLQSDMEVSASEAEERAFSGGAVGLDRVTKEQLYAAYRRTQERYTKYRTQYGDLARHYKLLERENAKARSVLVETQDKALRRISELREQCSLEQSAKAHLEKALRIEIEERNMKIDTLNTKVQLLQNSSEFSNNGNIIENTPKSSEGDGDVQLINLSNDNEVKQTSDDSAAEILSLNNKVEKMEQLLNKYKDSLKTSKEKNSQINTELQILTNELETKNKDIENLKLTADHLTKAEEKIKELNTLNEELQNKINVFTFNKTREQSTLEVDYQKAQEKIVELRGKIEIFSKKEEEYAISLAENKLSIHKELESKEAEIRSLKDSLDVSKKEIQSLNIVVNDYKKNLLLLETEHSKHMHDTAELTSNKSRIADLESRIEELSKKCQSLEQSNTKADEGYKCLQLQLKQETAEKLAMIDRNGYLENRNTQLSEENTKKSTQIGNLDNELQKREKIIKEFAVEESKTDELLEELSVWKDRYAKLESEIQEERDELIKLQTEIETLLANHESSEKQNIEFRNIVYDLKTENAALKANAIKSTKLKSNCLQIASELKDLKNLTKLISNDAKSQKIINNQAFVSLVEQINYSLNNVAHSESTISSDKQNELNVENTKLKQELKAYVKKCEILSEDLNLLKDENNNLIATISELESKSIRDKQFENITNKYEIAINELSSENDKLSNKMSEIEKQCHNFQIAMEFEKKQYSESVENINSLENEKQSLIEKVYQLENVIENGKQNFAEKLANVEISLQKEKQSLIEQISKLENERQSLAQQASSVENTLENEKLCLAEKVSKLEIELENEKQILAEKVLKLENALENEKQSSLQKVSKLEKALENEKQSSAEKLSKVENVLENEKQSSAEKLSKLENALDNEKQSSAEKISKLENALEKEKQSSAEKLSKLENALENEKQSSAEKLSKLENALGNNKQNSLQKVSQLENEKQSSVEKVSKLENMLENEKQSSAEKQLKLENALEHEKQSSAQKLSKLENALENEKQSSAEKLTALETEKHSINVELNTIKVQHEKDVEELNTIKLQNTSLLEETQRLYDKVSSVTILQEDNKKCTLENISLKSQVESIADNYKILETEINDVRKSHAEIETEKDRLNEIIEKLESCATTTVNQDSQTDEKQQMDYKDTQIEDGGEVVNKKILDLQGSKLQQNCAVNNNELSNQYLLLKTEYDAIKEENRRFKSDIEGLQSYLTKISKENSVLNDKLRELIATSEHLSDNNDVSTDLLDLKKEVQSNKERIDDLLRENSLLIEENLELKDQLQTQNYSQSESKSSNDNEKETSIYKGKYNNLLQVNNTLEKRVVDLEQIHKSVHGNMSQMQDKNEKLRLSNEKLERRLDEALVSLRHLHSLQENTELEYLRNILYEYLTGSGMHSVTLAKVLSAIVKFDDLQTKLVLQKEKERQGFLRQLGII